MNKIIPIKAHAILSASGSKKWMSCTPSVRTEMALSADVLTKSFDAEESEFSEAGTLKHDFFELKNKLYLKQIDHSSYTRQRYALTTSPLYDKAMDEQVEMAFAVAQGAIDDLKGRPGFVGLVEQRVDFSDWVPEGFGTGDLVLACDGYMHVMDLKGGSGIRVDAEDNSQLRLYALGAMKMLSHLSFERIRMTIIQPALNNYDSEEITAEELLDWAENVLKPKAAIAFRGEGEFVPGEHCRSGFCKARFTCAARAAENSQVINRELTPAIHLTTDQLAQVLDKATQAKAWLNDIQEHALKLALSGVEIPGYTVIRGKSNRKIIDIDSAADILIENGYNAQDIYETNLLSPAGLERLMGKEKLADLLGDLITRGEGKATLVSVSDKRLGLSKRASPNEDFK